MKNPGSNENKNSSNLNIQGGTILTDTLLQIFKYNRLNKAFSEAHDKDPIVLINALLEQLDIKIDITEQNIRNIPAEGAFIAISNHPFRGIDSMLLFKLIFDKRKDFKILVIISFKV